MSELCKSLKTVFIIVARVPCKPDGRLLPERRTVRLHEDVTM